MSPKFFCLIKTFFIKFHFNPHFREGCNHFWCTKSHLLFLNLDLCRLCICSRSEINGGGYVLVTSINVLHLFSERDTSYGYFNVSILTSLISASVSYVFARRCGVTATLFVSLFFEPREKCSPPLPLPWTSCQLGSPVGSSGAAMQMIVYVPGAWVV